MVKKPFFIVLGLIAVCVFSGCDKIKELAAPLLGTEETPEVAVAPPAPAPEPVKQMIGPDEVIRIGNWSLSKTDFMDRLEALKEVVPDVDVSDPETKELVREELIRQQLIVVDAEKKGLASQKDIVDAVDEFRRTLIVRESIGQLLDSVNVSDEEAREFYEARKGEIVNPLEWRIREIAVDTEEKAKELQLQALQGTNFSDLARQNSTSDSAANGGDLGFVSDVPFQEMARPLLSLEVGETSNAFAGPSGFYIIKLEEKRGGDTIPFEDVKDDIVNSLLAEKQQLKILEYVDGLRDSIEVQVNNDAIK